MVLNADKLKRQLVRLSEETDRTVRSGLSRLAFEAKDQVERDVGRALNFSSPGTQKFVAGGFRVRYSFAGGLFTAIIYPLRKAGELLARHVERTRITPSDRADMVVDGRIAVPLASGPVKRGRSGKVPKGQKPAALLARDAQGRALGFIAGAALFIRGPAGKAEAAYALERQTENPARVDVQASARVAVIRRAGAAFGDAIGRAIRRAVL